VNIYPKISIIIPIYNAEQYLRECLDSAIKQTLPDIEIICVDDCSTDGSLTILEEYAKRDNRIVLIKHTHNKSASQARKDGVMLASGEYIMFLDSDDTLKLSACEELHALIKEYSVEILHFGIDVNAKNGLSGPRLKNVRKITIPYNGRLENKDIFTACFKESKYTYSLFNKIYLAALCKKAFQYVKDGFYNRAEDLYAYFIISYFAQSYYGIPEKKYYNYNIGRGITGRNSITLHIFEQYCSRSLISEEIKSFLISQRSLDEYVSICDDVYRVSLSQCVSNWYELLQQQFCAQGFDLLLKYFGAVDVVSMIAQRYYYHQDVLAKKLFGARSLATTIRQVKKIGIFYHRISIGGVERKLSLLVPIWVNMGYEVFIFTNEPPSEYDRKLPDSVKRIVIPSSLNMQPADYKIRAEYFRRVLNDNNIDIVLYYAGSNEWLLYDLLIVKSSGVPFVVALNEIFSTSMTYLNIYNINKKPFIFKMADLVVVLSNIDKKYWKIMGVNVEYIPNPLTFDLNITKCAELDNQNVVWVGRFDIIVKQYLDAVKIFAEVVKQIPGARLLIVGNDVTLGATASIKKEISRLNLENNVLLCGYSKDVSTYYLKSSIHLVTSIVESFSNVIGESKSFGLPCVMYEMPYLEMLRDGMGYIAVEQGNIQAAANAIIKLLSDDEYRKQMGRDARQSIEEFSKFDIATGWQEIFKAVTSGSEELAPLNENDKELNIILNAMLFHYSKGCELHQNRLKQAKQESIKAKNELKNIRSSLFFRIGSAVTYLPRKMRDGIRCWKKYGFIYTCHRVIDTLKTR
jgi:glycosyltransferase involved in cell wall biosynthesis